MKLKLEIEPRPVSTWGINLSSRPDLCEKVFHKPWIVVSQQVKREADWKCEVCGNGKTDLFCHEVWKFDDRSRIQYLVGLECCCRLCSDVHHLGRSSQVYGRDYIEALIKHWCEVNKKTIQDFLEYENSVKEISRKRADHYYIVKAGRRVLA